MEAIAGRVITPGGVLRGRVVVDDDTIAGIVADSTAPDRWVCPGFIELQINGTDGIDIGTEPERIAEVAAHLPGEGTTSFLPTVISGPDEIREAAIDACARIIATGRAADAAHVLGLHLEGPVLAPGARGAHPLEHLQAPASVGTDRWTPSHGVRLVTIAPELPGARELIAQLAGVGVVVSLGHTLASVSEFVDGVDAGATMCTHLFNGMRPFHHREPGPVGAVLGNVGAHGPVAGLICDGHHVHPTAVAMAWRALGPVRLVLVTDAVAARGSVDVPPRSPAGTLLGSVLHLDQAVRNLVAWTGASVPDAVATVTSTPARILGLAGRGCVEPGAVADLTVLDDRLDVAEVFVAGRRVR